MATGDRTLAERIEASLERARARRRAIERAASPRDRAIGGAAWARLGQLERRLGQLDRMLAVATGRGPRLKPEKEGTPEGRAAIRRWVLGTPAPATHAQPSR
jgi:hypothetical protein